MVPTATPQNTKSFFRILESNHCRTIVLFAVLLSKLAGITCVKFRAGRAALIMICSTQGMVHPGGWNQSDYVPRSAC